MAKPGPKPKGEFASKGATLSARLTTATRQRLDEAAKASGNSVSQEVEQRLRRSLGEDAAEAAKFGTPQTYALLRMLSEAIGNVEQITGAPWYENRFTFDQVLAAADTLFDAFRPTKGSKSTPPATFPNIAGLAAFSTDARRAIRIEAAKQPIGKVAAQTVIALMQADPDGAHEHLTVYRRAADKLLKRLRRPVLPYKPKNTTREEPQK